MTEHLDLDALADLLVGEGAPGGGAGAHLSTCPDCAARLAELEEAQAPVTASLGSLPAPALPDDLASRITAALAAQPPLRPAPDGDTEATNPATNPATDARSGLGPRPAGATVTPLAPRRAARRRWLPAAAAVVLLGGVGLGYTLLSDSRSGRDAPTAALGASADREAGLVRRDSALDYAEPAAVAAALPAVLAGSPGEVVRREAAAPPPSSAPVPAPNSDPAGTPLAARPGEAAGPPAADPLGRLREPDGLASCLLALLPPDQPEVRPLALDYALYRGMPALAVVLPDADPAKVSVFVVGPQCSRSDDDTLFFTRLAKP